MEGHTTMAKPPGGDKGQRNYQVLPTVGHFSLQYNVHDDRHDWLINSITHERVQLSLPGVEWDLVENGGPMLD